MGQQKLETIRAITELVGAYVKSPNCVFRDQANSFGRRKKTASFYPLWDDYDKTWLHQKRTKSGSIYSQRVARIYDDRNGTPTIYILKPDAYRYWTRSMGLHDADEVALDLARWNVEAGRAKVAKG